MGVDRTEQDKRSQKANKARDMGGDVPRVSQERKDDQRMVRGKRNNQYDLSQQTQTDTRSGARTKAGDISRKRQRGRN